MAPTTQRLKYFDGEFLQSGDFTDEQTYHVDMRRLLNQQLHLHGIARGLRIVVDANSVPSSPAQFLSVTPGFAIDQIGREIYVTAPASLTPLLSLAGLQTGTCEIWIVYTETATGTPAPGYKLCNQLSQNTRWTESFALVLRNPSVVPAPGTPNPNHDLKGVCLGLVTLNYNSTIGFYFTLPPNWYSRRSYVKIRAQSIIAPDDVDPDPFIYDGQLTQPNVVPPEGYIHLRSPNGVYAEGNMFVENNALIGDDFQLYNDGTVVNAGLPNNFKPDGNLKVAGDLFLQGQLYEQNGGDWRSLDDYIKSVLSVPDIQLTTIPFTGLGSASSATPSPTQTTTITTILPSYKGLPTVNAFISSFSFVSAGKISTYAGSGGPAAQQITINPPAVVASGPSTAAVTITLNLGTGYFIAASDFGFLVDTVTVGLIAIFQPS